MNLFKYLSILFILNAASVASAAVIEGRLVAKIDGEFDPFVLGEGCLSIIDFYNDKKDRFVKIGIFQSEAGKKCISYDVDVNEEIDFDPKLIRKISNPAQLQILKDTTSRVMKVKAVSAFYRQ
jgi:5'(3')-deoxyribonucleotidase